jgi:hypothetical protein
MDEYFPVHNWYTVKAVGYLKNILDDVFYDPPTLFMVCCCRSPPMSTMQSEHLMRVLCCRRHWHLLSIMH